MLLKKILITDGSKWIQKEINRMRYRNAITETAARIVRDCMDKKAAIAFIRKYARLSIPLEDQSHFVEAVKGIS